MIIGNKHLHLKTSANINVITDALIKSRANCYHFLPLEEVATFLPENTCVRDFLDIKAFSSSSPLTTP